MVGPDVVSIVKQDVDPALVVAIPRTDIPQRVGLRQAFGKVNAVSIHMKLLDPEIEDRSKLRVQGLGG